MSAFHEPERVLTCAEGGNAIGPVFMRNAEPGATGNGTGSRSE